MAIIEPVKFVPAARANCPICGKTSYSRDGIHPQCAMQKADEPRMIRLLAEKKAGAKRDTPRQRSWMKKCSKCKSEIPVRRDVCDCGFKFGSP